MNQRYHYLDNLRSIAMLLGVVIHICFGFSETMKNLWIAAGPESHFSFDIVGWFLHSFRMPLFFIISGFFAFYFIENKSKREFLKNRFIRIFIPFLIFFPLTFIFVSYFFFPFLFNTSPNYIPSFVTDVIRAFQGNQLNIETFHLWFLYNLFIFSVILILFFNFFNNLIDKILNLVNPILFMIFFPLLLVPALSIQISPHPAPDFLYPQPWSLGFFGILFLFGGYLYKNLSILDTVYNYRWYLTLFMFAIYFIFYLYVPKEVFLSDLLNFDRQFNFPHGFKIFIAVLESYLAFGFSILILSIGSKHLNKSNKVTQIISDSSYWVYIVHIPIIMVVQVLLFNVTLSLFAKSIIILFSVFGLSFFSYILFVRYTPLGALLNGNKNKT